MFFTSFSLQKLSHFAASFCLYFRRISKIKEIRKILVVFHVTLQNLFLMCKIVFLFWNSTFVQIIPHLPPQKDWKFSLEFLFLFWDNTECLSLKCQFHMLHSLTESSSLLNILSTDLSFSFCPCWRSQWNWISKQGATFKLLCS